MFHNFCLFFNVPERKESFNSIPLNSLQRIQKDLTNSSAFLMAILLVKVYTDYMIFPRSIIGMKILLKHFPNFPSEYRVLVMIGLADSLLLTSIA
jgi:hypothetical protein